MKRVLCLSLLMVLMLIGCAPAVVENNRSQSQYTAGQIVHREQGTAAFGYGMEEVYQAAEQFVRESGFFQKYPGNGGRVRFRECYSDVLYLFSLKKGEAQLVLEVGHTRWRLYMEKTFLQEWQVTACLPDSGADYTTGKT